MKQSVINYECDVIQKQTALTQTQIRVQDPRNHRYSTWRLCETIQNFVSGSNFTVKWVGCDPNSHILSLYYCLLVGCLQNQSKVEDLFIKLKYSLYQQSKETLNLPEQKIFIQHLGLIQDSKNIGQFLKKSNHLENIFLKIFLARHPQNNNSTISSTSIQTNEKISQLSAYAAVFPFINLEIQNEKCAKLKVGGHTFFIVEQKQCFFIVQIFENVIKRISNVNNINQKIIQTDISPSQQVISSMKTQQLIESKRKQLQRYARQQTEVFSKFPYIKNCDYKTSQKGSPIKKQKISLRFPMNNYNQLDQNQDQQFEQQQEINEYHYFQKQKYNKLYPKQIKSQKVIPQFIKSQNGDVRNTIINEKRQKSFEYNPVHKIFVRSKQKQKQIPHNQEANIVQKNPQNYNTAKINSYYARKDFIYQSLNPQQVIQAQEKKKKESSMAPTFSTRVPKFLAKKHESIVPVTFSHSPERGNISPKHLLNKTKYEIKNQKYSQHFLKTLSHKHFNGLTFSEQYIQLKSPINASKKNTVQMPMNASKKTANY